MASILAILAQTHDREIYRDFVATVFRIPTLSPTARAGPSPSPSPTRSATPSPPETQVSIGGVAFTRPTTAHAAAGASTVTGPSSPSSRRRRVSGLSGP
jgi:hypothetical protein